MKTFNSALIAFGAVASVSAQASDEAGTTAMPTGPVIDITFPGGLDDQVLVGSLIGTASQLTTVLVGCPEGTDQNDCGFNPPVTVTAGSTTLRFALMELEDTPPFTQDCSINADGAVCTVIGAADSDDTTDATPVVVTTTTSYAASELQTAPVTITAGDTAGLSGGSASPSSTSAGSGGLGGGAAGNGGAGSNVGGSSSSSNTSNDARILIPGGFGAALLGLAAMYL